MKFAGDRENPVILSNKKGICTCKNEHNKYLSNES